MNKGIEISQLRDNTLTPVKKWCDKYPFASLEISKLLESRLRDPKIVSKKYFFDEITKVKAAMENIQDGKFKTSGDWQVINQFFHRLPVTAFQKRFDLDGLAKLHFNNIMHHYNDDVKEFAENNPNLWMMEKIKMSSWHWGGEAGWNIVAEAYNSLAKIDLNLGEGFTYTIDTSSHYNNKGYSKYNRIFLDSEIGILAWKDDKHVLTVGINIIQPWNSTKRVLQIRQVQCKNRKGNRWMFGIKEGLLNRVVNSLSKCFPKFEMSLVKGETLVEEIREQYGKLVERREGSLKRDYSADYVQELTKELEEAKATQLHFETVDSLRLIKFYSTKLNKFNRVSSNDKDGYWTLTKSKSK